MVLLPASIIAAESFIRPIFKEFKAILNPLPRSANIFSTGILVSVKNTCLVEDDLIPNLCSSSPKETPFGFSGSYSKIKAEIFLSSSIRAKTINVLAKPALEIHIF